MESSTSRNLILDLADYILAGGWIPPLVVRQAGEQAIIVDGHRRFAATRMAVEMGASIERMACVSVPRMTNTADWTALMLSSQKGRKLSPQEQIEPIKRLMRWMQDDVSCGGQEDRQIAPAPSSKSSNSPRHRPRCRPWCEMACYQRPWHA